jgi:DHA1 family multidrug resistance protein-like MFS transporter
MQPPHTEARRRSRLLTGAQARLLLPLGAAMALSLTGDSTLYVVLPNQVETVGISLGVVGVLLGANRMIRIPGNVLAGALHDRAGRRRLFLLGLVLGILSTLSYTVVTGFWPLLGARLLWGIAWSLINVGGYTMILDRSTSEDRGRMTGFYQMAFMFGLALSPLLGGTLTDLLGFRPALYVCAAVSGLGLVAALVSLPETRPPGNRSRRKFWNGVQRQRLAGMAGAWRRVDRRILLAACIYLVTLLVNSGVLMSTISLYMKQRWGATISVGGIAIGISSLAGFMLTLRALSGMLAGPLGGHLSDRLRNRWPVVRGALLMGVAGFLLLTLVGKVWIVPLGVILASLGAGALLTALAALVGDLAAEDRQGVTMGSLATAGDVGSAAGPPLAYALAVSVDLHWVYLSCAAALVLGLVATFAPAARQQDPGIAQVREGAA